jgi:tetratricopeptide (TPR) repeat protein
LQDFTAALASAPEGLQPPPLVDEPPRSVRTDGGTLEIKAEDYRKYQRFFDVLDSRALEESPPQPQSTLNGEATWASFAHGQVIRRVAQRELLSSVEHMNSDAADLLIVSAPLGWGKTFLLRQVAVDSYNFGIPILWLNPTSTLDLQRRDGSFINASTWDHGAIGSILRELDRVRPECQAGSPLIIADNCAERIPEVLGLLKFLRRTGAPARLIMSLRDSDYEIARKDFGEIHRAMVVNIGQSEEDGEREVEELVNLCFRAGVGHLERHGEREKVLRLLRAAEASASVLFALVVIFDKEHRPFKEIIRGMWSALPDNHTRALVLRTAAIHSFGSTSMPRLVTLLDTFPDHEMNEAVAAYRWCLEAGVLLEGESYGEPTVRTFHPLIAESLVATSDTEPEDLDNLLVSLVANMAHHPHDSELLKRLCKRIADYDIRLSGTEWVDSFFIEAARVTSDDPIVCQQYAKYLLQRDRYEEALEWAERGVGADPDYAPLTHTKGNVLRRWGMEQLSVGDIAGAAGLFDRAREAFAQSRLKRGADEYGFVTQLDMLISIIGGDSFSDERDELRAEGISLYREGLSTVPRDKFNMLLDERFRRAFDPSGAKVEDLVGRLQDAIGMGRRISVEAREFVALDLLRRGRSEEALRAVPVTQDPRQEFVRGQIMARLGELSGAGLALDNAYRGVGSVSSVEFDWRVRYWGLIVAFFRSNYELAARFSRELSQSSNAPRTTVPRGYAWRASSEWKPDGARTLMRDAWLVRVRVGDVEINRRYGQFFVEDFAGQQFWLRYNPRFFPESLRKGDRLNVAVAFLPNGLRGEDPGRDVFSNRPDDIYLGKQEVV